MKIIRCLILTLVVYFAIFSIQAQTSRIDKFVDLGLPSGLLWGSANLGAESSSDFGGYYIMNPEVDMATETLGENCSTPTRIQFEELISETSQSWTQIDGVNGMRFLASNGNSIFLPAAAGLCWASQGDGGSWDINNAGSGSYWTKTRSDYDDYSYFLEFDEDADKPFFGDRRNDRNKLTIRPVAMRVGADIDGLPDVDRITVDVVNGVISVIGLPLGVAVTIFDLNGVIVYSGIPQDMPSLGNGIYIVDVMSKMHKVIL